MKIKSAGKIVYDTDNLHKITFVKNLLEYSDDFSRSVAKNSLWYLDTDNLIANANQNTGFESRRLLTSDRKDVNVVIPLNRYGFFEELEGRMLVPMQFQFITQLQNDNELIRKSAAAIANRKQVGGSLLTSVLALGRAFGPTIAKTIGLSALAGLASEGASQIVKKISGKGQKGGFLIPQIKIDKLIANKHLLSTKQKRDLLDALQSGLGVRIIPTKTQSGGFLDTLLASIGGFLWHWKFWLERALPRLE